MSIPQDQVILSQHEISYEKRYEIQRLALSNFKDFVENAHFSVSGRVTERTADASELNMTIRAFLILVPALLLIYPIELLLLVLLLVPGLLAVFGR